MGWQIMWVEEEEEEKVKEVKQKEMKWGERDERAEVGLWEESHEVMDTKEQDL